MKTLNAETTQLEEQLKLINNEELRGQVAVKKSQAQVVIVKNEELRSQIATAEEEHRQLQEELNQQERTRLEEEEKQRQLQDQLQNTPQQGLMQVSLRGLSRVQELLVQPLLVQSIPFLTILELPRTMNPYPQLSRRRMIRLLQQRV